MESRWRALSRTKRRRVEQRVEQRDDFAVLREATRVTFAEDSVVAHTDVEHASAAAKQGDAGAWMGTVNLGRHTGSLRSVVSNAAVFDRDVHGRSFVVTATYCPRWASIQDRRPRLDRCQALITLIAPPTISAWHLSRTTHHQTWLKR